jgi:hypothetical protein
MRHSGRLVGTEGPRARHPMSESLPRITIEAEDERLEVTGRAALVIYLVAVNAEEINSEDVGKLVASFAANQTKVKLRKSLPSIRLDRPPR